MRTLNLIGAVVVASCFVAGCARSSPDDSGVASFQAAQVVSPVSVTSSVNAARQKAMDQLRQFSEFMTANSVSPAAARPRSFIL